MSIRATVVNARTRGGRCDELEIAKFRLQLNGFGIQRGAPHGDAVVVGPPDVVGVDSPDRLPAKRTITLVEDLEEVGVHQVIDRVGHWRLTVVLSSR
jgi:hypothetical protein